MEEPASVTGTLVTTKESLLGTVTSQRSALNASFINSGETYNTTLTVHYGIDGKPGEDGFSPLIDVYKDTTTEYILKITDVRGSFLTPNLKGEGGGGTIDVSDKVDEDLLEYGILNALTTTKEHREQAFLYVRQHDMGENKKIPLSVVALEPEVEEKIKTKLQTVQERPTNWRVGDYIFLEI